MTAPSFNRQWPIDTLAQCCPFALSHLGYSTVMSEQHQALGSRVCFVPEQKQLLDCSIALILT